MSDELTAGASVASALINTAGGIYTSRQSQKAAEKLTARQIAWERERAQNAHQWEMADLRAAGLNPALTAGGTGAQTSGITGAMGDYAPMGEGFANAAEKIMSGIEQARRNKKTVADVNNTIADTNLKEKKAATEESNKILIETKTRLHSAQEELTNAEKEGVMSQKQLTDLKQKVAKAEEDYIKAQTEYINKNKNYVMKQTETEEYKQDKMYYETQDLYQKWRIDRQEAEIKEKYGMSKAKQEYVSMIIANVKQGIMTADEAVGLVTDILSGGALKAVKNLINEITYKKQRTTTNYTM